jgi:hypothetical protein
LNAKHLGEIFTGVGKVLAWIIRASVDLDTGKISGIICLTLRKPVAGMLLNLRYPLGIVSLMFLICHKAPQGYDR